MGGAGWDLDPAVQALGPRQGRDLGGVATGGGAAGRDRGESHRIAPGPGRGLGHHPGVGHPVDGLRARARPHGLQRRAARGAAQQGAAPVPAGQGVPVRVQRDREAVQEGLHRLGAHVHAHRVHRPQAGRLSPGEAVGEHRRGVRQEHRGAAQRRGHGVGAGQPVHPVAAHDRGHHLAAVATAGRGAEHQHAPRPVLGGAGLRGRGQGQGAAADRRVARRGAQLGQQAELAGGREGQQQEQRGHRHLSRDQTSARAGGALQPRCS